jgi:hypothetical protein
MWTLDAVGTDRPLTAVEVYGWRPRGVVAAAAREELARASERLQLSAVPELRWWLPAALAGTARTLNGATFQVQPTWRGVVFGSHPDTIWLSADLGDADEARALVRHEAKHVWQHQPARRAEWQAKGAAAREADARTWALCPVALEAPEPGGYSSNLETASALPPGQHLPGCPHYGHAPDCPRAQRSARDGRWESKAGDQGAPWDPLRAAWEARHDRVQANRAPRRRD